jgi:rod shape-determining protein MreD
VKWALGILAAFGSLLGHLFLSAAWPASVLFFDLPLLVVLYYGLQRGPSVALVLGAGFGIVQDSLTGSLLGAGAVSRSLVGYAVGVTGTRIDLARPVAQLLLIAGGTVTARVLELLTLAVMGRRFVLSSPADLLASAIGNAIVGLAAFRLLRKESLQ